MTPRIAILVPVLAAAGIAVAGCGGGNPSASGPTSSTPVGSQSASPRPGLSVAPSNLPPAAGSGSAGGSGAAGGSGGSGAAGGSGAVGGSGAAGGTGATGSASGGGANRRSVAPLPAPNGNNALGSLPAGFPLPDGTLLGRIAVSKTEIDAPMQVPDGEKAVAFWKKELPAAGYQINAAGLVKEIGDIRFIGNGCKRGSDLAVSGEQVAFLCRR